MDRDDMKMLLTSSGIANPSIEKAFFELIGKKPEETKVAFIPTASNLDIGDKWWLIKDLVYFQERHFLEVDIVDISAVEEKIWKAKLERADVLFFEGGSTFYLMEWINKSGLKDILPDLLKTRVYVGVSAGSMVTAKSLDLRTSQDLYDEDFDKEKDMGGLSYVDFFFLPHVNSDYFKKLRRDTIEKAASERSEKIYAMDDQSALKIVDGQIEVVSEGEWFVLNER